MDLAEYLELAKHTPERWNPDPFDPHRRADILEIPEGVQQLLRRFDFGKVKAEQLLSCHDTGRQKRDVLSFWLYFQHHPGSEIWKLQGQRCWSVAAWRSWRGAGGKSLPKKGEQGLRSEHVVPKKVMRQRILEDREHIRFWLGRNLCCAVTREEDLRLPAKRIQTQLSRGAVTKAGASSSFTIAPGEMKKSPRSTGTACCTPPAFVQFKN